MGEGGDTASRAAIEKRARGRATIAERDLFISGMTWISCAFIHGFMNCCTIKQECVSCMTTTYVSEEDKFKLLSVTINSIYNDMNFLGDVFPEFQSEIRSARTMCERTDDHSRDAAREHARSAIKFWKFRVKFRSLDIRRLSHNVKLLRQIIDLLNRHLGDVWTLGHDVDRGRTPRQIYNIPRDTYFRNKPREPGPPHVESTEAACVCVNALLLELHDLSERDI